METAPAPRVVNADRLDGGVIIEFADGKCAVFSASLLYASLPQATEVKEPDPEDEVSDP